MIWCAFCGRHLRFFADRTLNILCPCFKKAPSFRHMPECFTTWFSFACFCTTYIRCIYGLHMADIRRVYIHSEYTACIRRVYTACIYGVHIRRVYTPYIIRRIYIYISIRRMYAPYTYIYIYIFAYIYMFIRCKDTMYIRRIYNASTRRVYTQFLNAI